ncbi:MAG: hypothetical protein LIQ30_11345 [Planctomycetes bacterium]|nr:hypothetical protein [Planctomycetota bacterium]
MSLDKVKSTVLEQAEARAREQVENARAEADRLLADGRQADERNAADRVRDARLRLERESARELERVDHDNRMHVLSAKNRVIDEVFKRVLEKLDSLSDSDYVAMIGKWLDTLPADAGGTLRVNPKDVAKFTSGLDDLNRSRSGAGRFTEVTADSKVPSGAVVEGPDYRIDCTIHRRLLEIRETSLGELAKMLFI